MKELSIEDKAKRYDEAIIKFKPIYDLAKEQGRIIDVEEFENIFSELKESEDKRIRKELIDAIQGLWDNDALPMPLSVKRKDSWIAWLEKQGGIIELNQEEQNRFSKSVLTSCAMSFIDYLDAHKYEGKMCVSNGECMDIENAFHNAMWDRLHRYYCKYIEKQGEKESVTCPICGWEIEKQGEQKPKDNLTQQEATDIAVAKCFDEQKSDDKAKAEHLIPQKGMYYTCIKDYYSSDNIHLCVKGNIYKSFFNGYIDDESHLGLSWTNSCTEKYFEPTKDEDWIVCEHDNVIGGPMQYKEFKKKATQKFVENLKAKGLTPKLRLWNLQDVKDGDILYAKGSYFKEYIFMFSSFTEDNVISTHFGYDAFHGTFDKELTRFGREEDFVSVTPATKEQRDVLEKAMADAGYTFDFEKKELKKIWNKNPLLSDFFKAEYERGKADAQKPAEWSEEDEKHFNNIIQELKNQYDRPINTSYKEIIISDANWFKSLKDRVQPKQEWSEEDNRVRKAIIDNIQAICEEGYFVGNIDKDILIDWIKKSLRPRKQWKPSEEQIMCLQDAINDYHRRGYKAETLGSLYKQLKKLTE